MLPLSAVTAFAEDTSSSTSSIASAGDYKYAYEVDEYGNATITEFLGPVDPANDGPYDITIPATLGGHLVTGLGESSFSTEHFDSPLYDIHHTKIQSVTIPENVTSIGRAAFLNCTGLTSLTIKGDATSIGAVAFSTCTSLTSLSLVGSFQTIGEHAFASCNSLTSLSLTCDVQKIGDYAFVTCNSLTSLSLTGDIQKIGDYAFYSCPSLKTVALPKSLTSIGSYAFGSCTSLDSIEIPGTVTEIGGLAFNNSGLTSVKIDEGVQSTGTRMFYDCGHLTTVTFPESLKTIANGSFAFCSNLNHVKIPARVTCIGDGAFSHCTSLSEITLQDGVKTIGADAFLSCKELTSITLPDTVTDIGKEAFQSCEGLESITIPKNVTTIEPDTFYWCFSLKDITLPAGLTSFQDDLSFCPAGRIRATDIKTDENGQPILNPDGSYIYIYTPDGTIYYKNYKAKADALLADNDNNPNIDANDKLRKRNFLYLCKVTFDAKGGELNDDAEVPVYKTEKITDTKANDLTAIPNPTRAGYKFTGWYTDTDGKQLFNADETITKDITLYAGWKSDPNAPGCHPLTVTGGTVTVKYDGSDVTSKLNSRTDETTGQKTYDVPDGATVTVTLDKTAVPNGKVFDGWSTSLPTGQDYKAESITFSMSNDVNVSAKYRDAATDHTPDTAVCRSLTVTGGIVTVKNGDKDVTDTLTVTTDETTGKKTYSVPDGATVTVTLDKTLIPEGMVFDIWSTGKFSLPLGQDYKAETITFPMSSDVDIAAQYRDASIEDDGPNVLGTAAIIGTAAVGGAVLGYQAYSLGAEFAGKLMALPYFPSNRSALAMMLWEDAGKPMPESELLYPDVGQEERDMDLQHAARWAMENELIPDLNDEGTAPEEMKFFPANPVSKLDVLNAWQKAQELKNN
uniref:leucine-rich repeat protein n=1 Tax=Faecalibacterium prausnitzii TaxID=853 RepID=UPI003FEF684D